MRSPISRRSISSWLSPGPPRKPKPPRCRSRWVHERTSRERAPSRSSLGATLSTGWSSRQRPVEGKRSSCAAVIRSGFVALFARLEELDGLRRHYRRDRVLVDKLRVGVAPKQYAEIVEPGNDSLELHAIHEEYGDRGLVLADVI